MIPERLDINNVGRSATGSLRVRCPIFFLLYREKEAIATERKGTMQLKLTTDYAIRTLLYLAENKGIVPIAEVAGAMSIPEKYLNRIGLILRDAGLIMTHRGQYGGYSLGRPPADIRLYDVVRLMEGTVALNRCLEEDVYCGLGAERYCTVHKCYSVMQRKWENFLRYVTIEELLGEMSEEEIEKRIDHHCPRSREESRQRSEKAGREGGSTGVLRKQERRI